MADNNLKEFYDNKLRNEKKIDKASLKRYNYAIKNSHVLDGMNIVDIGCKMGACLQILKKKNINCHYHGIDISKEALRWTQEGKNIKISIKDIMEGLPVDDGWADRVFLLEVLEHLREPIFAIEEIARILKPDGMAIVSTPNPYYWINIIQNIGKIPDNEGHIQAFSWIEMNSLCNFTDLELIKVFKTFDVVPYSFFKPYKRGKVFMIKAIFPFMSQSCQYLIKKKRLEEPIK